MDERESNYYQEIVPGLRGLRWDEDPAKAMVDLRVQGEQMNPCTGCEKHADQIRCRCYRKASQAERCMHLRFNEFCAR